jgi:hypothetical protein
MLGRQFLDFNRSRFGFHVRVSLTEKTYFTLISYISICRPNRPEAEVKIISVGFALLN